MTHRSFLDAEMYRGTPLYDKEDLKALSKIQQVPEKLEEIKDAIAKIRKYIDEKDQLKQ